MPSSHLILCRPLLLLPPNPSQHQGLFQWKMSLDIAKCTLKVGQKSRWLRTTDLLCSWHSLFLSFFFNVSFPRWLFWLALVFLFVWFFVLASSHGLRDLGALTRSWTWAMAVTALSPNHWTATSQIINTRGDFSLSPWCLHPGHRVFVTLIDACSLDVLSSFSSMYRLQERQGEKKNPRPSSSSSISMP